MAEKLIRANAVKETANALFGDPILKMAVDAAVDAAPTVDAVEVAHGRWIWKDGCFHCSKCKTSNDHTPKYCEGCGAKMDGGTNNG